MFTYLKKVRPEDWPALLLRVGALLLITVHLIVFLFIYQHPLFILSALVMGLLLAREMYEDLSQRFFRLKAEEYEKELHGAREDAQQTERHPLLIEGAASLKDISTRSTRH
ncbi:MULTISPECIES: hypothetical protein [Rhodovulum]|uniref:Uncharacterized protein n=2 Tax=Rhodovulum TaxID=34008 RepID=A0A8E2VNI9_9RHOB|nr:MULTISPECIES: hypothetical protein [Rhodovulum]PTW51051.1 hypothetical protein C8N38_103289 [Rhodovulum kholense]RAP42156.1 hypothetical protein BYZ73_07325 [Rhodovulum viride]